MHAMVSSLNLEKYYPEGKAGAAFGHRVMHPWLSHRPTPVPDAANVHDETLQKLSGREKLAYLHVPFCTNHCVFCGFYREPAKGDVMKTYIDHLLRDLAADGRRLAPDSGMIDAVYLGGGTPSALSADDLSRLVSAVRENLPLSDGCEITMEGRVFGFSRDKLDAAIAAGVNRISIGVQTFDTNLRRRFGRKADKEAVVAFLKRIQRGGQAVLVCDLIFGLPGQTEDMWRADLELCCDLGLDGVDLYQLNVFEKGPLAKAIADGKLPRALDFQECFRLYEMGHAVLAKAGWKQISQAHWAATDRERNIYNGLSKCGADCLPFGSGAGGLLAGHRFMLDFSREAYQKRVASGEKPIAMMARPTPHAEARNYLMAGMEEGRLDLGLLERMVGEGFAAALSPLLERWRHHDLIRMEGTRLELRIPGMFWHNNLAAAMFEAVGIFVDGTGSSATVNPFHMHRAPTGRERPHSHGAHNLKGKHVHVE